MLFCISQPFHRSGNNILMNVYKMFLKICFFTSQKKCVKLLWEWIFVPLKFEKENYIENIMLIASPSLEILSHQRIAESGHYGTVISGYE